MSELICSPTMKMSSSLACLLASRRCLTTRKAISYRFLFAFFLIILSILYPHVWPLHCEVWAWQWPGAHWLTPLTSLRSPHLNLNNNHTSPLSPQPQQHQSCLDMLSPNPIEQYQSKLVITAPTFNATAIPYLTSTLHHSRLITRITNIEMRCSLSESGESSDERKYGDQNRIQLRLHFHLSLQFTPKDCSWDASGRYISSNVRPLLSKRIFSISSLFLFYLAGCILSEVLYYVVTLWFLSPGGLRMFLSILSETL